MASGPIELSPKHLHNFEVVLVQFSEPEISEGTTLDLSESSY